MDSSSQGIKGINLKGVNLYLVGMMGSGKTTVAQCLAHLLDYRFLDTDAVIEQVAGRSIPEIFATDGEANFRQIETQVLAQVTEYTRMAIATGGGIVLDRQNWSYLQQGVVVWLDVPIDQLCQRLQGDEGRPLLKTADPKQTLTKLLGDRQNLYAQADVKVTVAPDEEPDQTAERVLHEIQTILRPELKTSVDEMPLSPDPLNH